MPTPEAARDSVDPDPTTTVDPRVTIDPDAVVWSDRLASDDTRPLVVLMHGRGSNERDLSSLVPYLPVGPVYASLRAPFREGPGWAWFASGSPGAPDAATARASTAAVIAWLDSLGSAEPAESASGSATGPIAVAGFSQGGAMTLELLRHSPERFAGFVNLAGFVIGERETDASLEALARPVFWGRDPADPVIPESAIDRTRAWLPAHSSLTAREYHGVGHSLSGEEIADAGAFLIDVLGLGGVDA